MIAIIAAMSEEVDAVVSLMDDAKEEVISNFKFNKGKLSGADIVVLQCGIGKVAAALGTAVLFENYEVEYVINTGVAGGLLIQQEVLDVVVSTQVAHHDIEGPFFPKGYEHNRFVYDADKTLIDIVSSVIKENDRVFIGPVASGDCFVHTKAQVEKILNEYPESICAEMEAAGIAQVCRHYNKPFVVVRSLSDVATKEGNEMQYDKFVVLACERGANWCKKFIGEMKLRKLC